jgi:hypothetical protein
VTTAAAKSKKKQLINAARKKYMRHLIKTSNTLAGNTQLRDNDIKKHHGIGVAATNLIEYYKGAESELKDIVKASVNDIVLDLLLLDNHMYMHIVSDYELKK